MRLFNSLTKTIEDFVPLEDNNVRIYSCGPTVYDHVHIGNLSAFIYADTLRRTLKAAGHGISHVMNFTDVDDKTIKRSREENHQAEPRQALQELTERYAHIFLEDMHAIGNDVEALTFTKATDYIEQMQELIMKLLHTGIAYIADDGVYFSIKAYRESGKTYGQLLTISEASTSEERIQNDEYDKESAHDFALWKKQKDDEPSWQFEINDHQLDGRPGWHIECSAMSEALLGRPFDIHTGGIDLIFPHHENEIAQSTAVGTEATMARFFVHNEHILVDGKKMSKSLNNFFTLEDLREKGFDPLSFRLLVLQSHYRSQSNFTWETLQAMQTVLSELRAWADLRFQNFSSEALKTAYHDAATMLTAEFMSDLATPAALALLNSLKSKTGEIGIDSQAILEILPLVDNLFGLKLLERQDINQTQKSLLGERQAARDRQDWASADQLREQLKQENILVRDTPQGQAWERI